MDIETQPCCVCKQRSWLLDIDALSYLQWSELGYNIQEVFPDLDADQRELLVSGTHAHCWERLFGEEDEA